MTQKFIRKFADFHRIRSLGNWIWLKAANPKMWTLAMCATYALLISGWVPAIIDPPNSLQGAVGMVIMYIIASMVVIGSVAGVGSAFWGVFKVEKWAVLAVGIGIIMYVLVVQGLHWTTEGNRLPQAQTIAALIPTFVARFVHVTRKRRADDDELLIHKRPID